MANQPLIPKPLKRYKATIFLSLTWIDLAFLIFFAILIILFWAFIKGNFWVKFALTIIVCMIGFFLTMPINDKKGYIEAYYWLKYLFSKKNYQAKELKLLNPYGKIDDDHYLKLISGSHLLAIKLTGFNIDILQIKEQLSRIKSFQNFLQSFDATFSLVKANLPSPIASQEKILLTKIKETKKKSKKAALAINLAILEKLQDQQLNHQDQAFLLLYGEKENLKTQLPLILMQLRSAYLNPEVANENELKMLINSFYNLTGNQELASLKTVKFKSTYLKLGPKFSRIIAITSFPEQASIGWLDALNFGKEFDWNIKIESFDKIKAIKKLDRAIKNLEVEVISTKKASQDIAKSQYLDDLVDLNKLVTANGESLKSTYSLVKVSADSLSKLNQLTGNFISHCKGLNIKYNLLRHLQKEGWESILPKPTLSTKQLLSLELPTAALAYGFPFSSEVLKDPSGIYLGYTNSGNNIYFDLFKRDNYRTNSNIVILGTSGSGKSTTGMKLIKDQFLLGAKVIIIDPEREYKQLCHKLEGTWINFGADKLTGEKEIIINPLQFFKTDTGNRELLSPHIQFLEAFFQTIFPDLTLIELSVLRGLLIKLYDVFGITSANSNENWKAKSFPRLSDLAALVEKHKNFPEPNQRAIINKLALYLQVFTNEQSPEYKLWNGYTNFVANNAHFLVMDTHTLEESGNKRLSNAQLFLLLKFVNALMIQNKIFKEQKKQTSQKLMIVIDEAHLLIDERHPFGLDFMYQMVKRARKYDAATMITTQNIKDFVGGSSEIRKKTSAIINTSQYAFLLGLNPGDIEDLDQLYQAIGGLTELEKDVLATAKQGQGIFALSPKERKIIQIDLATEELELLAH